MYTLMTYFRPSATDMSGYDYSQVSPEFIFIGGIFFGLIAIGVVTMLILSKIKF